MRRDQESDVGGSPPALTSAGVPDTMDVAVDALETAANHLAALAARAAGASSALIQLRDGPVLRLLGGYQLPAGWEVLRAMPMSETLSGVIFDTGHRLLIEDIRTDPRVPAGAPAHKVDVRAYAGFPITDAGGTVVGVCCVLDERPRVWTPADLAVVDHAARACAAFVAEQAARWAADRDRRFLHAVVKNLDSAVAACDQTGQVVLFNPAMDQLSPSPMAEFRANHPASARGRYHPDGRPMLPSELPLARAARGERVSRAEVLLRAPGRADRLALADARPVTDARGRRMGAVVAFTDVTERRRAERFRDCELRVATVLSEASRVRDAAPNVVAAVGGSLGWRHAELWLLDQLTHVLRPAANWTAPDRTPMSVPDELPCGVGLAGEVCESSEARWITDLGAAGSPVSAATARAAGLRTALAVPVRGGPGTIGVLAVFGDVPEEPNPALVTMLSSVAAHVGHFIERRRAEELELQLAQSKDEYLALVGHELRTPLTSIGAYAALLLEADPATFVADGPELVRVIDRNAAALREIVDDLLDLAALDTGHASVLAEPVDLAEVVHGAVADARTTVAGAGLTVSVDLPDHLLVTGDRKRLRQVVDSLLANAIKYTPEGGRIGLAATTVDAAAELVVSDTGIGIPPDERDRLFERFYRSSRTRERAIPGAGLSLAISRAIVRRHGGSIVLVPGEGPGTRIVVRLPLAQV